MGREAERERGRWHRIPLMVAAAATVVGASSPAAGGAQETHRQECASPRLVGSLGITGIECERCQFITTNEGDRAVFYTEPMILGVDEDAPAAEVLREGDVVVAIDGSLITTSDGWDRFSNLPSEGSVTLRVRRDGRVREVRVPLLAVCPTPEAPPEPVMAGRPVPPPPPGRRAETAAEPAVAAAVPGTPSEPSAPWAAVAPSPPSLAPNASLGFGFQCTQCSFSGDPDIWDFTEPPVVTGVAREGPARVAGLRQGDRLMAIDGVDITTEEGGRRFASIEAGDRVVWTVERDGRRREVTLVAEERRPSVRSTEPQSAPPARASAPTRVPTSAQDATAPTSLTQLYGPLSFAGTIGNVTIQVRGDRVTVMETDGGRLIIIRTGDTEIRLEAPIREGRR